MASNCQSSQSQPTEQCCSFLIGVHHVALPQVSGMSEKIISLKLRGLYVGIAYHEREWAKESLILPTTEYLK